MGGRVGLHPVWLIFALFAFGYLFGFAGMLIAVPASAAVGVLVRFFVRRYRESRIYQGDEPDEPYDVTAASGTAPEGGYVGTVPVGGIPGGDRVPPDR